MPVVIDNFEVVPGTDPAPAKSTGSGADSTAKKKEKKSFTDVLVHWRERHDRIRAH